MRAVRVVIAFGLVFALVSLTAPIQAQDSATAVNKALVRRYSEELYNQRNLGIASEIFAEDAVFHQPGSVDLNLADVLKSYQDTFAGFPDAHIGPIYAQVAEGDYVVNAYVWEATSTQTGKKIQFNAVNLCRIENGKIAEVWHVWDYFNMMQQMGLAPVQGELPPFTAWAMQSGPTTSSLQQQKDSVAASFAVWPERILLDTVALDMTVHLPPTFGPDPQPGVAGYAIWTKQYRSLYPEFALTGPLGQDDYVTVAEGDLVVILYRTQFHFTQDLPGFTANGAMINALGLSVLRFKEGEQAEFWVNVDTASIIMQMSAPPTR